LAKKGVRIVNREPGAGSRALLDAGLAKAGVDATKLAGYDTVAPGHLAAAWTVKRGEADCCVAPRVAAKVFGLDFVPLKSERYDLVIPEAWLDRPSIQALLDTLQRGTFRRELQALGGYDTTTTGTEVRAA
jgi:molybdate-binding protein